MTGSTLKHCPDCGLDKPAHRFARDKSKHNGLRTYCKLCDAKRSSEYYQREAEKVNAKQKAAYWRRQAEIARSRIAATTHKTCNACRENLPVDAFHLKGTRVDGTPRHESKCRNCRNEAERTRYATKTTS